MLLRQIEYFVKVVDYNSFTEAAEQCFISQSAISQQIKALENELGVQLLQRQGRSFYLTAEGNYIYAHGKELLKSAERMRRGLEKNEKKSLVIGYCSCIKNYDLYKAIDIFHARYQDVTLNIKKGTSDTLSSMLRKDTVDLIINELDKDLLDGCNSLKIFTSAYYIDIAKHNQLARKSFVTTEEISNLECIVSGNKNRRAEYVNCIKQLGLGNSCLFANDEDNANILLLADKGFKLIEEGERLPFPKSISRLPLYHNGNRVKVDYYAVWKRLRENPYAMHFAEILRDLYDESLS